MELANYQRGGDRYPYFGPLGFGGIGALEHTGRHRKPDLLADFGEMVRRSSYYLLVKRGAKRMGPKKSGPIGFERGRYQTSR